MQKALLALGVPCDDVQQAQLSAYFTALHRENEQQNLTRITEETVRLHLLDSAALLLHINGGARRVLDVGTGGGVPGMVLAILQPQWQVTLLDATRKKVEFLQRTIEALQLENVCAIHARVEELAHQTAYRETFDVVTARAVAALPVLMEYLLPFVAVGGEAAAYKGEQWRQELMVAQEAIALLGGRYLETVEGLPESDHCIVRVEKVQQTPPRYPRKPNQIKNQPLSTAQKTMDKNGK